MIRVTELALEAALVLYPLYHMTTKPGIQIYSLIVGSRALLNFSAMMDQVIVARDGNGIFGNRDVDQKQHFSLGSYLPACHTRT